ncbi:exo-alpha-sialidase neuraminidase [Colletotrichum higginsianum]|nr:exo-alpha-sialidase neuraminidase [Colletotrichum higginsianum]
MRHFAIAVPSLWHLLLVFLLVEAVCSLEVTPGSDCAALCLGGPNGTAIDTATSGTNSSDIVCENDQYHSTGKGIKFRNCVSCLQKSQAAQGSQSDAAWFLYNIRYTVDVCLFDFPEAISNINSPCIINSACRPLKNALTAGLTTPDADTAYDYCTADADSLLGLTGQLFSTEAVNITESATNTTMPGDGGASATTMTLGTIVGIAVGGGLVFVGAICLFIIYCRKQRKQRMQDEAGLPPRLPRSHASSVTAINKSPYAPITDHKKSSSVNSYNYELQEKQNFSSNADYYDRLEQDVQVGREAAHYNFDPHSGFHGPSSALPTHPAYIPRAMSRQSNRANTPSPPNPRRTNTPESYALQTYLTAGEDPGTGGIRPPPQAAVASSSSTSRTPSPARSHGSRGDGANAQPKLVNIPPPPPGGPPPTHKKSRIPSLLLPSVPRIRVPKQYPPPQIIVEGATPVAGRGEAGGDMHISQPLTFHGQRFQDRPLAGHAIISQVAVAREVDPREYEGDMPIRSGKSTLYG